MFAFAFGYGGRFLIRDDLYIRGYGLRTCLNILYPRATDDEATPARIRALRSKRRGATVVRSDVQASSVSAFEVFNVNRLRDVISAAAGVPAENEMWGRRISGGDPVHIDLDVTFDEMGALCRRVDAAYDRDDYKDGFAWIDDIQPVSDPHTLERLEDAVLSRLVSRDFGGLTLAPPEIVDWEQTSGFRYAFDDPGGRKNHMPVMRPDLRLEDFVAGLGEERVADLDVARLRRSPLFAITSDGNQIHKWTVWRSLIAELQLDGQTYVLDEGEFFAVDTGYLAELNAAIDELPTSRISLPPTRLGTSERKYNESAAASSSDLLFLDFKLVSVTGEPGRIEVCDLLSKDRCLIHIKRHFTSSGLSHLFSQGVVSASLLQENKEFRQQAQHRINTEAGDRASDFTLFSETGLETRTFTIVYGIIARWGGRSASQALPFFSKINLREAVSNLRNRDYRVALAPIEATVWTAEVSATEISPTELSGTPAQSS
jgi:uncharacterized protein (TIGR04141 family)